MLYQQQIYQMLHSIEQHTVRENLLNIDNKVEMITKENCIF